MLSMIRILILNTPSCKSTCETVQRRNKTVISLSVKVPENRQSCLDPANYSIGKTIHRLWEISCHEIFTALIKKSFHLTWNNKTKAPSCWNCQQMLLSFEQSSKLTELNRNITIWKLFTQLRNCFLPSDMVCTEYTISLESLLLFSKNKMDKNFFQTTGRVFTPPEKELHPWVQDLDLNWVLHRKQLCYNSSNPDP